MHTPLRVCAWLSPETMAPCRLARPTFVMTVETATTVLPLPLCADHLPLAVTRSFAAAGVVALYIQRTSEAA